jgi:protocatechuate 3,4-dioxygenase beta subunit
MAEGSTSTSAAAPRDSRRSFLRLGTAAAAGLSLVRWAGPSGATTAVQRQEPTSLTPADFAALRPCKLVPEQTQGPFYADLDLVRRDITEGLRGHPLRLGLQVVDAGQDCRPVPDAMVDIWHADVDGDYSAFVDGGSEDDAGPGTTFLRGTQVSNRDGIVEFRTNYPGWYTGRAVHIHVMVHLDGATVATTQLYFPEEWTDRVHAQAPYAAHGTRDTRNEDDFIAGDPAAGGNLVAASADGTGTLGLVVLGINPRCNIWERWWYWLIGQPERCA